MTSTPDDLKARTLDLAGRVIERARERKAAREAAERAEELLEEDE